MAVQLSETVDGHVVQQAAGGDSESCGCDCGGRERQVFFLFFSSACAAISSGTGCLNRLRLRLLVALDSPFFLHC